MVGSAVCRKLRGLGYNRILVADREHLDLTRQEQVQQFFSDHRPEYVFLCAARVGGIHANSAYPADFIRDNLSIQTNVIDSAWRSGAKKLLFLGSSCIYPRDCPQPIKEEYLLTGPLEPTNEWYAVAKIAGIKLCQAYRRQYGFDAICAMPTNLYGPGDNYHPENSHVVPALIRRIHEAKLANTPEVLIWGSGRPLREFLHVDDLADALLFLMRHYSDSNIINVGSGQEISISDLARIICKVIGYQGQLKFDDSKPDGTPRKLLNVKMLGALGWKAKIKFKAGVMNAYRDFLADQANSSA